MAIGIGIGIPFNKAKSWKSYWIPRFPSLLVLTVNSEAQITLGWTNNGTQDYDDIRVERGTDGINFVEILTVTKGEATKANTGLTAYTRYYYRIRYRKGTHYSAYSNIANDWTAWKGVLTATGTGEGVSTIRLYFQDTDIVATIDGNGKFYSDSGGTLNESASFTFVKDGLRTRYLKVPSGTSNLLVFAKGNWLKLGDSTSIGWTSSTNAPSMALFLTRLSILTDLRITGTSVITGALPATLTNLNLNGASIEWTDNSALPTGLTTLILNGNALNWTGVNIGNNGNIATLSLLNYRVVKMSSADMVTLLTQMKNRTGSLPATVTINDYADYASPPAEVTTAVNALKAAKSVTTVNLGA